MPESVLELPRSTVRARDSVPAPAHGETSSPSRDKSVPPPRTGDSSSQRWLREPLQPGPRPGRLRGAIRGRRRGQARGSGDSAPSVSIIESGSHERTARGAHAGSLADQTPFCAQDAGAGNYRKPAFPGMWHPLASDPILPESLRTLKRSSGSDSVFPPQARVSTESESLHSCSARCDTAVACRRGHREHCLYARTVGGRVLCQAIGHPQFSSWPPSWLATVQAVRECPCLRVQCL